MLMRSDIKVAFEQFTRNERWGSCVDCPHDVDGRSLPELCKYTDRRDHQLNFDALSRRYMRGQKK